MMRVLHVVKTADVGRGLCYAIIPRGTHIGSEQGLSATDCETAGDVTFTFSEALFALGFAAFGLEHNLDPTTCVGRYGPGGTSLRPMIAAVPPGVSSGGHLRL